MVYALTILRKVPQVLEHFQEQYRYICVDEAQDTSRIQHTIIALLASKYDNLFMVGDEDQSIYGFRAACPEALINFEKEHRGAKVLLMEQNYRSGSGIVRAADRFIQKNTLRHAKHMVCADGAADGPEVREVVLRSRKFQYNYLLRVADGCEEETAVLYRNNESAIPVVDLLERNNVPYRIRNAEVGFFTHRTVMDISNIIKLAYDPRDVDAFMAVLETAIRYADLKPMTLKSVRSIRTHLENLKDDRGDQAVLRIVRFMGYGEYLANAGIRDSKIYILKALGAQTESPAELLDRIGYLEDIFRGKESDPDCSFILSTIHASKGLEYDTVYLMDVVDGLFPEEVPVSMKYMQPDERRVFEEERRLFYVGMTRAKKRLCVFTTGAKSVLADELFGRDKVRKR